MGRDDRSPRSARAARGLTAPDAGHPAVGLLFTQRFVFTHSHEPSCSASSAIHSASKDDPGGGRMSVPEGRLQTEERMNRLVPNDHRPPSPRASGAAGGRETTGGGRSAFFGASGRMSEVDDQGLSEKWIRSRDRGMREPAPGREDPVAGRTHVFQTEPRAQRGGRRRFQRPRRFPARGRSPPRRSCRRRSGCSRPRRTATRSQG